MKKVYANENSFIVGNARNLIEASGIESVIRNEFTSGVIGDVSPFDAWVELWVINDQDYEKASEIIATSFSDTAKPDWLCPVCSEINSASFDLCWNCQQSCP